jgi:hypothetical protein
MSNMGFVPLHMFWSNNKFLQWASQEFGGKKLNAFGRLIDWLDG